MILPQFFYVYAEIFYRDFTYFFSACGGCGCGGSDVCTFVIFAIFFNLAADLYSSDFGSVFVFSCLRWASIVVILAQYFCSYGEPLNNVI